MPQPPTSPEQPWGPTGPGVPADATAGELAKLAANRPDLWPQILDHPQIYEGLRAWISDNGGGSARADLDPEATHTMTASEFEHTVVNDPDREAAVAEAPAPPPAAWLPPAMPAPASEPVAAAEPESAPRGEDELSKMPPPVMAPPSTPPVVPFGPPVPMAPPAPLVAPAVAPPASVMPAPGAFALDAPAPVSSAPRKRKVRALVAAGVAVALVAAGGVALKLTDTWPFNPAVEETGHAAAVEAGPSYELGVEEKWHVDSADFGADARVQGYLPRMMGPINVDERAGQPVILEAGVLLAYAPESGQGGQTVNYTLLNTATGKPEWTEKGKGAAHSCVTNPEITTVACNTYASEEAELLGFDADGLSFSAKSDWGSVQQFQEELRVLEANTIVSRSLEGKELTSQKVEGDSGAVVSNAEAPQCVWLSGGDTVSYAGSDCDAPSDEVLVTSTSFNWNVVGNTDPIIIIDDGTSVRAFDAQTRKKLWTMEGSLPGWFQAPQVVSRDGGDGVLVWKDSDDSFAVVDLLTGKETAIDTNVSERNVAVSDGQVLAFSGDGDHALSEVTIFDGQTGAQTFQGSFPEIGDVAEVIGGPSGVLFSHYFCNDCSTAEGANMLDGYTFMGPAASAGIETVSNAAVPSTIAVDCPTDTMMLAWAEFNDGWVLVCGISDTEPTFMAYQEAGSDDVQYSTGAKKPTSSDAKAAVDWDAGLSRYTAQLENGDHITLDYEIGTIVRRDSTEMKTLDQQRFARYVFVVMSDAPRTVAETSQQDGAFDVQAPKDTAQDQARYMIEVLEKAYAGRALLKDALPKLQYCLASAGGYGDTVSAMKAVRDNRAELLTALDAMPVDKLPEGSALLDDLHEAIEASYRANVEYVTWAEDANASGCAKLSSTGEAAAVASDGPKDRFAARWNRAVAPKLGVRTFDAWYI